MHEDYENSKIWFLRSYMYIITVHVITSIQRFKDSKIQISAGRVDLKSLKHSRIHQHLPSHLLRHSRHAYVLFIPRVPRVAIVRTGKLPLHQLPVPTLQCHTCMKSSRIFQHYRACSSFHEPWLSWVQCFRHRVWQTIWNTVGCSNGERRKEKVVRKVVYTWWRMQVRTDDIL